jgi:predicted AAA+ superfamily ATPase
MRIERKRNLQKLINSRQNGQIKIITGVRRCGKSYLLGVLYRDYLMQEGVLPEQIISIELDNDINIRYRNPLELGNYLRDRVSDKKTDYYILLDEIQMVESIDNPFLPKGSGAKITFVDVLLGLKSLPNVDVYVTGSNSKMLSSDVATAFRDRGEQIHITPLTYEEFYAAYPNDKRYAWREFMTYGGMPFVLHKNTHEEKSKYLQDLFRLTYVKDVIERNRLRANVEVIDELLNVVASSVGSLSNPSRLSNTFQSVKGLKIKNETISSYLDCFIDAYILSKAYRYDIKGRSYIDTPLKYYFSDIGLRNARLNFRQQEENHIMENVIYNELKMRGFQVDVGMVEHRTTDKSGKSIRKQFEVDFVANQGSQRYYIQSAFIMPTEAKERQESASLLNISDSFKKIIIVKEHIMPKRTEEGIVIMGLLDFLLKPELLEW